MSGYGSCIYVMYMYSNTKEKKKESVPSLLWSVFFYEKRLNYAHIIFDKFKEQMLKL